MNQDNTKTSQNRQKKEVIVQELDEKVSKAKAFVFTNYQGLTHQQIEGLKKAAKKLNAEYVVTKNSLVLRALKDIKLSDEDKKQFEQPTATLFLYDDIIEPLKELAKSVKALKLPVIKFGIFDNKSVDSTSVIKLSTLPPLQVLRAQALGQMMAPVQGLHRALNWNMQSLVMTLNQIAQKKQN
ncbi:MAG: 50S ribosomal protein L10 [Proteobacteria bacterium]|nr:50S ribosomal protein L10 [Pseudomonadota bacterium]